MNMASVSIYYFMLGLLFGANYVLGQHENIPYQSVGEICTTCNCSSVRGKDKAYHFALECADKGFTHILARWPQEFGMDHTGDEIAATYSYNKIPILQQVPATNATLSLSCRGCGIQHLQAPTFMDVPYIVRLDLSQNALTAEELTPDVFRGPYRLTSYEPIALKELYLKSNQLRSLDKRLFEHTPNLTTLDLGSNPFKVLGESTKAAIASATKLQVLDLSDTGIQDFPTVITKALTSLIKLNLAGNEFATVPESIRLLGKNLQVLNMNGNQLKILDATSFFGLLQLRHLNISNMASLITIERGAFATMANLEKLVSSRNTNLRRFDMNGLRRAKNLTLLDISNCQLTTLSVDEDILPPIILSDGNSTIANTTHSPWPKLRIFPIGGNPWFCNCSFLRTIELAGTLSCSEIDCGPDYDAGEERCSKPYVLAGKRIYNMSAARICSMAIPKELHVVDEDPPRFLRHDYIILTVIIASVVIVLGFIIGFLVVCIRKRLKSDDYGSEPIRYTSVRSSNLSAFPPVNNANANGNVRLNTISVSN